MLPAKHMLKQVRECIIHELWKCYSHLTPQIKIIEQGLLKKNIQRLPLDHFAVIDLPGPHTGIPYLKQLFQFIGYQSKGDGYLPEKQNDFHWMAEESSDSSLAADVLPQVVVADFRLEELPVNVKNIIQKYSALAPPFPIQTLEQLSNRIEQQDEQASEQLVTLIINYLKGRDWPLPTINEFKTVHEFNELLAWVLVFGRCPNHFTLSIHLLPFFSDLPHFLHFVENELNLPLNNEDGVIKGDQQKGIAQGSTKSQVEKIKLADGETQLTTSFVEFVWRFSKKEKPIQWNDYYTDFIAQHANRVIESLYLK